MFLKPISPHHRVAAETCVAVCLSGGQRRSSTPPPLRPPQPQYCRCPGTGGAVSSASCASHRRTAAAAGSSSDAACSASRRYATASCNARRLAIDPVYDGGAHQGRARPEWRPLNGAPLLPSDCLSSLQHGDCRHVQALGKDNAHSEVQGTTDGGTDAMQDASAAVAPGGAGTS